SRGRGTRSARRKRCGGGAGPAAGSHARPAPEPAGDKRNRTVKRPVGRHILIVGPGKLGLALGSELLASGGASRLSYCGASPTPPSHPLFGIADVVYYGPNLPEPFSAEAVLIPVPDGKIHTVAEALARSARALVPILHTSGVLGPEPLGPLQQRGFPVGSLHPLVSIADPDRDAHKLHGAWYGAEGAPAALELAH